MKLKVVITFLLAFTMLYCANKRDKYQITKVSADSLVDNIAQFIDQQVEIEGTIVHVCGVDGKKMKLKTDGGAIVKVVSLDSNARFGDTLYKQRIAVSGIVKESRIEKAYVDSLELAKSLLCHIDNKPCKDTAWAAKQVINGKADSLSAKNIERLRTRMAETGKNYVSVITLIADKFYVLENR